MLVSYNWLKDYLGDAIPTPEKIAELLTFHSFEIESVEKKEGDTVIDVKVLPDRSSDCLCHRGIARELATLLGVELSSDPLQTPVVLPPTEVITVNIADSDLCPRFTVSLVSGVTVNDSPQWLQDRLAVLGMRSINNIVDATNYVMLALGQPLHAYDADEFPRVDGTWRFGVRPAKGGETVSLLAEGGKDEDRVVILNDGELVIVDDSTDTAIGLAGVKGGKFASVHKETKQILIEAANFQPSRTRRTARQHGILIEASKRFENEPSRYLPPYAQHEIIELITTIAGGQCEGYVDVYPQPQTNPVVVLSPVQVNALLGLTLGVDDIVSILLRLGVTVVKQENLTLHCVGPAERTDLNLPEDYIAEIGRVYGYEHVIATTPQPVPLPEYNARHYYNERVRRALVALGFSEVITTSFRAKDEVQLLSSLASDKTYLRSSLWFNLQETLNKNVPFIDWLGVRDIRVFEIGTVFHKQAGVISEYTALALGVQTKQSGPTRADETILATAQAAVATALGTSPTWRQESGLAETNFTLCLESLPTPNTYDPVPPAPAITVKPYSLFPSVTRDIAMWVDNDTKADTVINVLNDAAGPLRVRTTLVDNFRKDDRVSLAFRLVFQASDRTLTDEEVNTIMTLVYAAAAHAGWVTR